MPLQVGRPGQVSLKTPLFADPHKRLLILYHPTNKETYRDYITNPILSPLPRRSPDASGVAHRGLGHRAGTSFHRAYVDLTQPQMRRIATPRGHHRAAVDLT